MHVRELLESRVAAHPDRTLLIFEDTETSYRAFDDMVNRVANGLRQCGIDAGDRVCVMLPNCPPFLYTWFALMKLGAILVPINSAFRSAETRFILAHAGASAMVVDEATGPVVADIAEALPDLQYRISIAGTPGEGETAWTALIHEQPTTFAGPDIDPEQVASIIYTSGTTGTPKGVMQPHRSYIVAGESFAMRTALQADDRILTILPLFHANAQFYSTMGTLVAGATMILSPRFSASRFWEQVDHDQATQFNFIGAIARMLYHQAPTPKDADGFYFFVDRKKDIIRRRGENIASVEVERVLNDHQRWRKPRSFQYPQPSARTIFSPALLRPDGQATAEQLQEWCRERLAAFKIPNRIEFRSALPKTPTQRVEKYKLREEYTR